MDFLSKPQPKLLDFSLFSIMGIKGVGKDTLFQNYQSMFPFLQNNEKFHDVLKNHQSVEQVMFAGCLKEVAKTLFPDVDIEDREIKETRVEFETDYVDSVIQKWTMDFFDTMNYPVKEKVSVDIYERFFKQNGYSKSAQHNGKTIMLSPRDVAIGIGSKHWLRAHNNIADLISQYAVKKALNLVKETQSQIVLTDTRMPVELAAINQQSAAHYILLVRYDKNSDGSIRLADDLTYDEHWTEEMNNTLTQNAIQDFNKNKNPAIQFKKLASQYMQSSPNPKSMFSVVFFVNGEFIPNAIFSK